MLCSAWLLLCFCVECCVAIYLIYNMYNICVLYDPFDMLSATTYSFVLCYSFCFAYCVLHVSLQYVTEATVKAGT